MMNEQTLYRLGHFELTLFEDSVSASATNESTLMMSIHSPIHFQMHFYLHGKLHYGIALCVQAFAFYLCISIIIEHSSVCWPTQCTRNFRQEGFVQRKTLINERNKIS